MEKLKKIASDVCIAAISIVIAGLIGVLIIVGGLLFILTKCLFCILFFPLLCIVGTFAGIFALFKYLSETQDD
jgi:hypothetical protein